MKVFILLAIIGTQCSGSGVKKNLTQHESLFICVLYITTIDPNPSFPSPTQPNQKERLHNKEKHFFIKFASI
jgi:hypothetical protein